MRKTIDESANGRKILITGADGFIGSHLCSVLEKRHALTPTYLKDKPASLERSACLDVTKPDSVREIVRKVKPDIIIHLAGNKNLNYCEMNPDLVYAVNYLSTKYLVDEAEAIGARFYFISSDYVFEGTRGNYTETDETNPATIYGKHKVLSEQYIMQKSSSYVILRTGAVYGKGGTFFSWIEKSLASNESIDAFVDTFFTPTYIDDVTWAFSHIIDYDLTGIFHVAGQTSLSRYEMARQIAMHMKVDPSLVKPASIKGSELIIALNSSLSCEQTSKLLKKEFMKLSDGLDLLFGS